MYSVGFDAKRLFHNGTGLGNYSRSLVTSLYEKYPQNRYVLFTPTISNSDESKYFTDNFTVVTPKTFSKIGWRSRFMVSDILQENIDIYHGLSHEIPFGIENTHIKKLVTIHDLIYKFFPRDFPLLDKKVYDIKWKNACKYADAIIATSEATKIDIVNFFDVPSYKIHVVYQTCSQIFDTKLGFQINKPILQKYSLPESYILFVGSITDRKNIENLVYAYHAVANDIKIPLVIVGNGREHLQRIKDYCNKYSLHEKIIILTTVSNIELPSLYEQAQMFVYPSKYEGFGIPIIEAFKKEVPVITSNTSCMPEIAGDAALFIEPHKVDSISNALLQLYSNQDLQQNLIQLGKQRALNFSQDNFALKTHEVYASVLKK